MSISAVEAPRPRLSHLGGGIGFRLLARVLMFSSAVTLVLTLIQLYLEYRHDVGVIESRLTEIERSYLGSVGESLWHLDQRQVALQLQGIMRLPDMQVAEVREVGGGSEPLHIVYGKHAARAVIARDIRITYAVRGAEQLIGVLHIEATLTGVYRDLFDKALIILASQGTKTFLVSFFILFIVHRLVTRHLETIAEFMGRYDYKHPPPPLQLQRHEPQPPDELDRVTGTFNGLSASLQRAYDALQAANARLESDIAVRRRTEATLREAEQRFRDYVATASDWFWETGPDHRFTYISEKAASFGYDPTVMLGKSRFEINADQAEAPEKWRAHQGQLARHEPFRNFEYTFTDSRGRRRCIEVNGVPVFDASGWFTGYRGTTTDRTDQRDTEERLRQAQKMEAVGQLTGGIAHDFNNLLTVIIGNAEGLSRDPGASEMQRRRVDMIREAGERGAALTHRLLAFSRRQTLQPRRVEINAMLGGMETLLRRALGETIDIQWVRGAGLWPTFIDPSQLESAILNLAINARDAMSGGGKLTVETANAHLDQAYADTHADVAPGQYVMVAVSDTGIGMLPEVMARAFEPFFTTKEPGRGTGLGLSMVYGFVKQSGGHVAIYSEVGKGTTVRLYLPRARGTEPVPEAPAAQYSAPTGEETILVVEDEAAVRRFAQEELAALGYRAIAVADAAAALAELERNPKIDLLFTDVVLPGGLNGRELAEAASTRRPGLRILFTSGYTENAVVHHGRLDFGVRLLNKPYRAVELARRVRAALDQDR